MEFRIFHAIFCDSFLVKSDSFAFDEYVSRVYEKYVFSIINIRIYHWLALMVIVLLNWARNALKIQYQSCDAHDVACKESSDIFIFTCALFVITAILVFASRNLEIEIMAKKNITSYKSYSSFLRLMEESSDSSDELIEKLDEKSLREIVDKVKSKKLTEHLQTEHYLVHYVQERLLGARLYISRLVMPIYAMFSQTFGVRNESTVSTHGSFDLGESTNKDRLKSCESKYTMPSLSSAKVFVTHSGSKAGTAVDDVESGLITEKHAAIGVYKQRDRRNALHLNNASNLSAVPNDGGTSMSSTPPCNRKVTVTKLTRKISRRMSSQNVIIELKGEHIQELFWLSNPALYFETVRFFIMLIALYIACWLVDYSASMVTLMWKVVAILPGIFSTINYLYVVKTAALLKAMYALDFEAADRVFQQIDGCRQLEKVIREKLIAKLDLLNAKDLTSDMEARAFKLFCDIDYDRSGVINRHEFSIYLSHMNISLNRKQWKATFRHIDSDANEYISFSEFFVFLYPEHSEAVRLERQRLEVIHERVDQHIQNALDNETPNDDIETQPSRRSSANSTWAIMSLSSKITNLAHKVVEHAASVENEKPNNEGDEPFARQSNGNNSNSSSLKNNSGISNVNSGSNHSPNHSRKRSGFGGTISTNMERRRSSSSPSFSSDSQINEPCNVLPISDLEDN
eukprot:gene34752-44944_t